MSRKNNNNEYLLNNTFDLNNDVQKHQPRRSQRTSKNNQIYNDNDQEMDSLNNSDEEKDANPPQNLDWGIFRPQVDSILSSRFNTETAQDEYLCRLKGRSYLHLQYLSEDQVCSDAQNGKQKFKKFIKAPAEFVHEEYTIVDRILKSTELFTVIHPRVTNNLKDKWQNLCNKVIVKLMNFQKDEVAQGIQFLHPIDEEKDGAKNQNKIIKEPVQFYQIQNRLFNGYYKSSDQFWRDVGLIFINTETYCKDNRSTVRVLSDTLKQIAIKLYKEWHQVNLDMHKESTEGTGETTSNPEGTATPANFPFPGEFTQDWCKHINPASDPNNYVEYLTDDEMTDIDLNSEADRVFLVKWRNQSYLDSTWEPENLLNCQEKINDQYRYNRSIQSGVRNMQMACREVWTKIVTQSSSQLNSKQRSLGDRKFLSQPQFAQLQTILPQAKTDDKLIYQQQSPRQKNDLTLRKYQLEGLNWLISNWHLKRNVILADEMGLGKTIQTISFFNHLVQTVKTKGPFLIVAPLSTIDHWKKTIDEWTNLNGIVYYDNAGAPGRERIKNTEFQYTDVMTKGGLSFESQLFKPHVVVTTQEVFTQDFEDTIKFIPFYQLVVDEAHRLKNKNSRLNNMLKELPTTRIILLTGTPIQNNTEELWSLLNFIEPKAFADIEEFNREYNDVKSIDTVSKLQNNLKNFILRRLKEDVEDSIPPLTETVVNVELTTEQKAYYRMIYYENKSNLANSAGVSSITIFSNIEMQLRHCCNHPWLLKGVEDYQMNEINNDFDKRIQKLIESSGKFILLHKLIPKLRSENKKILIFSQFVLILNLLEEYLTYQGIKQECLHGSVSLAKRNKSIESFNDSNQGVEVFLLSTKAGGVGINLATAETVIIFDSDWNPQNDLQATARAHRIGQQKDVTVYRLITSNTYEYEMFDRASKKLGLDKAVFSTGAFASNETFSNTNYSKQEKSELELLLRKGAQGILDTDDSKAREQMEADIENILNNRSKTYSYSVLKGTYSVSKEKFVSSMFADSKLDIHDENFWDKIIPKQESEIKLLTASIQKPAFKTTIKHQEKLNAFMDSVRKCMDEIIEAKLNMNMGNQTETEEEELLISLLTSLSNNKSIPLKQREQAGDWLNELYRPSRKREKASASQKDKKVMKLINNINKAHKEDVQLDDAEDDFQDLKESQESTTRKETEKVRKQLIITQEDKVVFDKTFQTKNRESKQTNGSSNENGSKTRTLSKDRSKTQPVKFDKKVKKEDYRANKVTANKIKIYKSEDESAEEDQ